MQTCPALAPCLQFTLETNQEAGIWGGKDEDERQGCAASGAPAGGRR